MHLEKEVRLVPHASLSVGGRREAATQGNNRPPGSLGELNERDGDSRRNLDRLCRELPLVSSIHIPVCVPPLSIKRETDLPGSCRVALL